MNVPVVLGINRTQDASICLMHGSQLVWAIQKERLTRLARVDAFDRLSGMDRPAAWTDDCDTLQRYQPLAACPLDRCWQKLPPRECHAGGEGEHVAMLRLIERGGTVFSAGATTWAQVLADGRDRVKAAVTEAQCS